METKLNKVELTDAQIISIRTTLKAGVSMARMSVAGSKGGGNEGGYLEELTRAIDAYDAFEHSCHQIGCSEMRGMPYRRYYTLAIVDEDGKWSPEMGSYDRDEIEAELEYGQSDRDLKLKDMRIITTDDDQDSINAKIAQMNGGGE